MKMETWVLILTLATGLKWSRLALVVCLVFYRCGLVESYLRQLNYTMRDNSVARQAVDELRRDSQLVSSHINLAFSLPHSLHHRPHIWASDS